jgi:hypothetical protein
MDYLNRNKYCSDFSAAALRCLSVFLFFRLQMDRYGFWSDLLLTSGYPVLITGDVGVGKTSLVEARFFELFFVSLYRIIRDDAFGSQHLFV